MPKRSCPQPSLDELFSDSDADTDVKPHIRTIEHETGTLSAPASPPTTPRKKGKTSAKKSVKSEDSDEPMTPSGKTASSPSVQAELIADAYLQTTKKRWTAEEDALLLRMMEEAINETIWDKVKAEGSLVHRSSYGVKYHAAVSILIRLIWVDDVADAMCFAVIGMCPPAVLLGQKSVCALLTPAAATGFWKAGPWLNLEEGLMYRDLGALPLPPWTAAVSVLEELPLGLDQSPGSIIE